MRQKTILIVTVLLCIALAFTGGCAKTEEPQKTSVSGAPPLSKSSEAVDKGTPPAGQEPAAVPVPTPDKKVQPASPSEETAVVPPPDSGVPAVPSPAMPGKPADRGIITVAGFDSAQMYKGAPVGWVLDRRKGAPSLKLEKGSDIYCLHMRSDGESSFGIKKGMKVDIKEYPYLNWRWKVSRLPEGGDVRKTHTDDQAMQFYVAFTPTGFPATLNTPVLGYIWDNEAPKDWTGRSTQIGGGKLRYVVVRNNADELGKWYTEKRNIYDDYRKLFKDIKGGAPPGLTHGVQLHINSQNTASEAEGYICEVYFSRK